MRILIIEDDKDLCEIVAIHLRENGYQTDCCNDGEEGLHFARQGGYDLILLDRMLPGMDGLALLAQLRREQNHTPVLMLTALNSIGNRVEGLDAGADDYLPKPFATEELLARIRAMLRRSPIQQTDSGISCGDVRLDPAQALLSGPDGACSLSRKEADLLELLLRKPGITLPRSMLFCHVWGAGSEVEEANLDGYMYYVRRRLKGVGSKLSIRTLRGVGFRLEECIC